MLIGFAFVLVIAFTLFFMKALCHTNYLLALSNLSVRPLLINVWCIKLKSLSEKKMFVT